MTALDPVGVLLVDKESGWTSHDVVAKIRSSLKIKKVGHAGTLDPLATGLLVLGVGRATRLLRYFQEAPKRYTAKICFGVATDTLDSDGAILTREAMRFEAADLEAVFGRFSGVIMQIPPMVSARRVEGRRLYEFAREGKTIEREARPVEIYSMQLLDFAPGNYPEAVIEVACSKGTYVRTLADDLARALGGRAHLTALRRTAIGSLLVEAATTVSTIVSEERTEEWHGRLINPAVALADFPSVEITGDVARAVENGMTLAGHHLGNTQEGLLRIVNEKGRLLAVYRMAGKKAFPEVVLS